MNVLPDRRRAEQVHKSRALVRALCIEGIDKRRAQW
jgi:hypothetical protein